MRIRYMNVRTVKLYGRAIVVKARPLDHPLEIAVILNAIVSIIKYVRIRQANRFTRIADANRHIQRCLVAKDERPYDFVDIGVVSPLHAMIKAGDAHADQVDEIREGMLGADSSIRISTEIDSNAGVVGARTFDTKIFHVGDRVVAGTECRIGDDNTGSCRKATDQNRSPRSFADQVLIAAHKHGTAQFVGTSWHDQVPAGKQHEAFIKSRGAITFTGGVGIALSHRSLRSAEHC